MGLVKELNHRINLPKLAVVAHIYSETPTENAHVLHRM